MAKGKRKSKAPTNIIECPAWCERGQEHNDSSDIEHWTSDHDIAPDMSASAIQNGGAILYEVHLGDHAKLSLQADDAGKLIAALGTLLADTSRRWTKRVELPE